MSDRPTVICLTPVKDEIRLLPSFLRSTRRWADRIVIADQGSTDGSRELASATEGVTVVDNASPRYDEGARQRLLIDTARELCPGPRVLIALDADELLTAAPRDAVGWPALLAAGPGTVVRMPWLNLLPGLRESWSSPDPVAFGYVDDGAPHAGWAMHSTRLPTPPTAPMLVPEGIGVLHLQYLDWEAMQSKQRWYQCWERIEHPAKRPVQVYRQYHHMDAIPAGERLPVGPGLIDPDDRRDIERRAGEPVPAAFAWDAGVLDLIDEHGVAPFRRLDLWEVDWASRAAALGRPLPAALRGHRPRRRDVAVLHWLARTQARAGERGVRWRQRALRAIGW